MQTPSVLVYSYAYSQDAPSLYSRIYDEYNSLSKFVKLTIIAEDITEKGNQNTSLVKVSKISRPIIHVIYRSLVFFLASLKHRRKYSIIYLRVLDFAYLAACIGIKKILRKKLVLWISNAETGHRGIRRKFYMYLYKKIFFIADAICCSSEDDITVVENYMGKNLDIKKIVVIKPGVNTSRFKPEKKKTNEIILLCVARIAPIKLIDYLIEAIPFIKNSFPNVKLKLVGPIEDKEYHNELKRLSQKLDCEKNVEFVGPVPYRNLPDYYNSAKIFLHPGEHAGTSMVTFEAMACGCPVIVAPVGARLENIENGVSGILLENKGPEVLAQKVIELLENDSKLKQIGFEARKLVEEKLDFDYHINELVKVFNNVSNPQ